ncbi:MAG: hypothetical protein D6770_06740 [Anaerolineae bacterium]|nr:MAG: hypothetical protein D6770_06740 [Anaerolineae bacterium]
MRRWLTTLFVFLSLLGTAKSARGQSAVEIVDVQAEHLFGEYIAFRARLSPVVPVKEATLFFRDERGASTSTYPATVNPDGTLTYRHDVRQSALRPFASLVFWFSVKLENGETVTSAQYIFQYDDNRFPWQHLEEVPLYVHWYDGDAIFGQAALDAARAGLGGVEDLIPLPTQERIDIYIYASVDDLRSALTDSHDWVAGHAAPDLGVVMVSVAPGEGQRFALSQQVPHELAHVLLYRYTGESYADLPVWLREGVATLAERSPNPDYERALSLASQEGTLLSLADLCDAFPPDAGRAFLAYAESQDFTRFLRDTYGNSGLLSLVDSYADGLDCNQGMQRALGISLPLAERRWREETLGENLFGVALRNFSPYLVLLGIVLFIPMWGILNLVRERRKSDGIQPPPT